MVKAHGRPKPGQPSHRAITPPRTREYEALVATMAQRAVPVGWRDDDTAVFAVELHIYRARRRGDTDNFIKSALDGMNGISWTDDESVVEIHAYRFEDKHDPRLDVFVTKVAPP